MTYWYLWLAAISLCVICSCHSKTDKQLIDQYAARLNKSDTLPKQLLIKDRSLYSSYFIDSLRRTNYPGSIKLENEYIVINKDTTRFPDELIVDSTYHFYNTKDSATYLLNIKRVSNTDLNFSINIRTHHKTLYNQQGTAILSPLFFVAAESMEDDITHESFGAYPYSTSSAGQNLVIRIGIGRDDKDRLLASISGPSIPQALQQIPVLRTK